MATEFVRRRASTTVIQQSGGWRWESKQFVEAFEWGSPTERLPRSAVEAHLEGSLSRTDAFNITFNIKTIQRSTLEWLFFFVRRFCEEIVPGELASVSNMR